MSQQGNAIGYDIVFPTIGTISTIDTTQTYTAAKRYAFSTLVDSATITPDFALANNFSVVLGGNRTLGVPIDLVAGQSGVINVYQDITGTRTLAYAWVWKFPAGITPIISTAALTFDQLIYVVNNYATSTITLTIATPCVVTWTAHGLISGQTVQINTSGTLPTGLINGSVYWATVIDVDTFKLSTTFANAQNAVFVNTSGGQSGVHTAINASITLANNLAIA